MLCFEKTGPPGLSGGVALGSEEPRYPGGGCALEEGVAIT